MDPAFHHEWARAWAAGETFMEGPYFRAPLYTWVLGTIYWLFGTGPLVPRIVQAIIGALNCGLLFIIGRRVFGRTVGVLSGVAAATYWIFVYFDAELLSPVVIVFLNLILLWALLATRDKRKPLRWLLNGVLLGVSALARPDILLFAPALLVWLVILHRPAWQRVAGYAACLIGGCLLAILPVTIRNYVIAHQFVPIASYGGVNLYIGNNPDADGMSALIRGDPADWWPCYRAQVQRAADAIGHKPTATEVSSYYVHATWDYVRTHPGEALARVLRKAAYFWTRWEIYNNQDIHFVTSHYTPIVRFLPLSFWIVGPLGLLGMLLSMSRSRTLLPLWSLVLTYMAVVAVFFAAARFRLPAVFVLILLGCYALHWGFMAIRARRWRAVALAAVAFAAAVLLVSPIPPNVDTTSIQGYRYAGGALAKQGRFVEAEVFLAESIAREGRRGVATKVYTWRTLGFVQLKQAKFAEAQTCYEKALVLEPDDAETRRHLALTLMGQGLLDQAIEQYEFIAERNPDDAQALAPLAELLVSRPTSTADDHRRAIALAQHAVEVTRRQDARAWSALAAAYAAVWQYADAIDAAQRGLALAREKGETKLAQQLGRHLQQYQSRQPP